MKFYLNHKRTINKIISVIIPSRGTRHALKAALQYDGGILRRLSDSRMMRNAARRSGKKKNFLAIAAIIKNEATYIREWIEYHRIVGVDKFFIYDNESTDNIRDVLAPYIESGVVEYKLWPGQKMQIPAYTDAIEKHKHDTQWIAFVDIDEFILYHDGKISEYLHGLSPRVGQVCIPWIFFGSNGHIARPNGLVIENYTVRARHYWQCKSIINPALCYGAFVHTGDTAGRTIYPRINEIRVNHYYCKSWSEYQRRKSRGDALNGAGFAAKTFVRSDFDKHDFNDVNDTEITKYIPMLRSAMK